MIKYEKGQVVENFIRHREGAYFDVDDSGAILMIFFNKPTQNEVEQFNAGHNFEIRFTNIKNIMMITAKIGNLNWMDAPYSPHLSKNLTKFQFSNEGQGLSLTLMLIDAYSGKIEHIRLIGLSEKFSKKMIGNILELKMSEFNQNEYMINLNSVFACYTTKDIVKMSRDYCKIK